MFPGVAFTLEFCRFVNIEVMGLQLSFESMNYLQVQFRREYFNLGQINFVAGESGNLIFFTCNDFLTKASDQKRVKLFMFLYME